jgi:hypothetical protein
VSEQRDRKPARYVSGCLDVGSMADDIICGCQVTARTSPECDGDESGQVVQDVTTPGKRSHPTLRHWDSVNTSRDTILAKIGFSPN